MAKTTLDDLLTVDMNGEENTLPVIEKKKKVIAKRGISILFLYFSKTLIIIFYLLNKHLKLFLQLGLLLTHRDPHSQR